MVGRRGVGGDGELGFVRVEERLVVEGFGGVCVRGLMLRAEHF